MERQNTNSALHDSVLLIARGRIDKPSEISQEAYKVFAPTLQEMRRNKDLHVSFAIDGLALALLKEESPELLDLLVELAKSKQAKLLLTAHSSPCALLLSSKQLSSQLEKNRLALKECDLQPESIVCIDRELSGLLSEQPINISGLILSGEDQSSQRHANSPGLFHLPKEDSIFSMYKISNSTQTASEITEPPKMGTDLSEILPTSLDLSVIHSTPSELKIPTSDFHSDLYRDYLKITEEFSKLEQQADTLSNRDTTIKRINRISDCIDKLSHRSIWQDNSESCATIRLAAYTATIAALVDIEAIRYAEVDPNEGWAKLFEKDGGEQNYTIDTQLLRMTYRTSGQGGLASCLYKPRKINLLNAYYPKQQTLSFSTSLLPLPKSTDELLETVCSQTPVEIDYLKTRLTPGLVGIRFIKKQNDHNSIKLIEDYTAKAGIGAYSNNSTTGFSFEHWIEGNFTGDDLLRIDWYMLLATPIAYAISTRTLAPAGAEGEHAVFLDKPSIFLDGDSPGGLHGMRLIDGVTNFVVDLRSSKRLHAATLRPRIENDTLQGIHLSFFYPANKLVGDENSNTVFVSIP